MKLFDKSYKKNLPLKYSILNLPSTFLNIQKELQVNIRNSSTQHQSNNRSMLRNSYSPNSQNSTINVTAITESLLTITYNNTNPLTINLLNNLV